MKKISILMLAILLMFTMTACGPRLPGTSGDSDNTDSNSSFDEDNGNDGGDNASSNNWADFYASYSDAMSDAYDSIENAILEEDFMYSMDMLNFISGDITLAFTSAFFGGDEAAVEMVFGIFGSGDIDYEESGDTAKITGVDSEGVSFEYELQYNASSQSALLTTKENGTVTEIMSICVQDNFYAKTYWSPDYGNVEIVYYTNNEMYMSWDEAPAPAGETLYKNVNYATSDSFGTSMANYLKLVDGVVSGSSTGF